MEKIGIIGAGLTGLVASACMASLGHIVICMDKDANTIWKLQQGQASVYESGLHEMIDKCQKAGRLVFTTSINKVLSADVIYIAVGMAARLDGSADLRNIENIAKEVARHINVPKSFVIISTLPVGTARRFINGINEQLKFSKSDFECDVAVHPQFIGLGSAVKDILHPTRLVFGTDSDRLFEKLESIYSAFIARGCKIIRCSTDTAEMSVFAQNAYLAMKIAYGNEIASICETTSCNFRDVLDIISMDHRIGVGGFSTGTGFGGKSLPRDLRFLIRMGRQAGFPSMLAESAIASNERKQMQVVSRIEQIMGGLRGKIIGILGLTTKPNSDSVRFSTSIIIARELWRRGAELRVHDPIALTPGISALGLTSDKGSRDVYEAVKGADAILLSTPWIQYTALDIKRIKDEMRGKVVIDLHAIFSRAELEEAGFSLYVLGG